MKPTHFCRAALEKSKKGVRDDSRRSTRAKENNGTICSATLHKANLTFNIPNVVIATLCKTCSPKNQPDCMHRRGGDVLEEQGELFFAILTPLPHIIPAPFNHRRLHQVKQIRSLKRPILER